MERVRVGEATAAHIAAALKSATLGAAVSVGRVNDGPLVSEQALDGTWRELLPTPAIPDEIADMRSVPGQLPPEVGDRAIFDEAVSELPLVKAEKARPAPAQKRRGRSKAPAWADVPHGTVLSPARYHPANDRMTTMPTGTVKWFDPTKGFGFITPDQGGQDAFVHISAVERAGLRDLKDGQKLSYELVADKRSGKMSADQLKAL